MKKYNVITLCGSTRFKEYFDYVIKYIDDKLK